MKLNTGNTIHNMVRIVRVSQGMTQTELAKRTGLSQWLISEIERGRVNPSDEELNKIKTALNWTPELDIHLEALTQ